jgi:hypothetical protein
MTKLIIFLREIVIEKQIDRVCSELGLDFSKLEFTKEDLIKGMNVELEHKDITGGNLILTAKIALAHLKEKPDYYDLLEKYVEK